MRKGSAGTGAPLAGKEYLLEFIPNGNFVKVCAIDPETGTEVSIVGPADGGEELLSRTAVNKLKYVLRKQRSAEQQSRQRGLIV
jgi:hypothetical protein